MWTGVSVLSCDVAVYVLYIELISHLTVVLIFPMSGGSAAVTFVQLYKTALTLCILSLSSIGVLLQLGGVALIHQHAAGICKTTRPLANISNIQMCEATDVFYC